MDGVMYSRLVASTRPTAETASRREYVTLTREVNRLVVWNHEISGEDESFTVVKTFASYDRDAAIEFAVACAAEAVADGEKNSG